MVSLNLKKCPCFQTKVGKMKKVLFSAALLLASSSLVVMATDSTAGLAPAAAAPTTAPATPAAPMMTAEAPKASQPSKGQKSKEEVIAKLTKRAEHVKALGAGLTGLTKELFDSAMGRYETWVKVINGFSEKDTNPSITAKRAKHELRLAKTIAKYANGIPAEKFTKWETELASLKDGIAALKGDMKSVGETQAAHAAGLIADAKKAKDSPLASLYVNNAKYEMDSLRKLVKNDGAKKVEAVKVAAPATMSAAPAVDMKAAPAADASKPAEKAKA